MSRKDLKAKAIELSIARNEKILIRFMRRFETATIRGYVLDVGSTFFLLALVDDRIWFDGFECFRISDISRIMHDPYASFVETALQRRGDSFPQKPPVDLSSISTLLASANGEFSVVTIHREEVDPHACWIGRVVGIKGANVSLLQIGADATWDKHPTEYDLNEITRVNFGGDYENALYLVGGEPDVKGIKWFDRH